MPFHGHTSSSSQQSASAQHMPLNAASGLFQVTQALTSVGAPSGNFRALASGTTTTGTDTLYPAEASMSSPNTGGQPASSSGYNTSQPNAAMGSNSSNQAMSSAQQYESPRRLQNYARQSDELHLSPAADVGQRAQLPIRDYAGGAPRIGLEQASPEASQFQGGGQVPGSLQAGGSNRPALSSINTAQNMPTITQSMSQDHYQTPSRTIAQNLSHSYSRSSPTTGYDGQSYVPFSTTPSGSEQFPSPTNQKYAPQAQQRNVSNTPLGLSDIRSRADSSISDIMPGTNPYSSEGAVSLPTNSNYFAPWAIYSFDWCKWPSQNNDAGKVAVGSYLEDNHNFVRFAFVVIRSTT